ncbi:MAG: 50S ribosomal protein L11 methyltransferase, partial [Pseudomonadota bacterium]|nr:50S ribosomal protein L11 methyltransferase [Pseudomonadota bacterium]
MSRLHSVTLQFDAPLEAAQAAGFEMVFSELLDAAATSHMRTDDGGWLIEALFAEAPDRGAVEDLLAPSFTAAGIAARPVVIEQLADRDWLAENRAAFPPRRIGRFWVYGGHVEAPPPPASRPLLVEAAQAFGSGTHPTTEGCLRAGEAILRRDGRRLWRVLDMGCGSAILGLGRLRARPGSRLIAADNDSLAVRTAAKNARINRLPGRRVRAVLSQGYADPAVRRAAPFDLIFANILAGPLCGMARDQMAALGPKGWLILSGILNRQAVMVERRYAAAGARVTARLRIGDWTTLVLRPARLG